MPHELPLAADRSQGPVTGILERPAGAFALCVLAHGAGADMRHRFMQAMADALEAAGVATLRFNFPYIENGRRSPDPAPFLQEAWRAAFAAASARAKGEPVWAGGKSLGGRIASMAVADGMPAAGLVFLGYPLHPPGKPERIRDEHLYRVDVPMIFVEGTRDVFATPDLLAGVIAKLGVRATLISIDGGDHSFNVKGARRDPREIAAALAKPVAAHIRERTT